MRGVAGNETIELGSVATIERWHLGSVDGKVIEPVSIGVYYKCGCLLKAEVDRGYRVRVVDYDHRAAEWLRIRFDETCETVDALPELLRRAITVVHGH